MSSQTLETAEVQKGDAPDEQNGAMAGVGRHALIYGLGAVLGKGVGFLMLPVYTRFLTPADYGVMELIEMTLDVISILAGAQLALGIFRYYHKAATRHEKDAVVSTALVALGVSYTAVGLLAFLGAGWISELVFGSATNVPLIRIASISLVFQSLMTVPLAFARVKDRSGLFVAANLVRAGVGVGFNILFLVFLGMGVKGVLLSSLIANVIVGAWVSGIVIREVGFSFSRQATRDLVRYGVPLMATQLATFLLTFGDRYFLQARGDATAVGLYSLAYQFGFILAFFGAVPFMRVWEQRRFAIADHPDRDEIYSRGFIYLNVLLLSMALCIGLFIDDVLRVMATPAFYGAAGLVPIILVAYILQSWTSLQDIGILIRERTEYLTLGNWIAAFTALAGYALLVPRYLGYGAAIATVIAFAVRHITIFAMSQRLWPVRYRWAPVLRLSAAAGTAFLVGALLPPMGVLPSIACRSLLIVAYGLALWRMDVLSDDDRSQVREVMRRLAARMSRRSTVENGQTVATTL